MNIVAHNLSAMNAQRQFGINTRSKAKSTEKLSSGYKINRAADDAAGLAISEKMRRQIRGLNQAAENIQEGISLVQVADGALNETHEILQRMNELAVKAANGTNSSEDREYIQCEIDQLIEEVDRIANDTSFNEEIYPLKNGSIVQSSTPTQSTIKVDSNGTSWLLPSQLQECTQSYNVVGGTVIVDGITYNTGQTVQKNFVGYQNPNASIPFFASWDGDGNVASVNPSQPSVMHGGNNENSLYFADLKVDTSGYVFFTTKITNEDFYLTVELDANGNWNGTTGLSRPGSPLLSGQLYVSASVYNGGNGNNIGNNIGNSATNKSNLWIQMGTEAGQGMYIDLVDATANTLEVANVDVTTQDNAGAAISAIKNAINTVSKYRSNFGAQQNRLEHGYNANMNTVENTTASESRIRDTDMAKEMVKYSNLNILEQVGHAIMAQANQSNQGVLNLLQ